LKGHEYFFEAVPPISEAVPDVKFLLVGDGIYRKKYEGCEAEFTGLVRPEEIPGCIARMSVLVHLSLREGLPRALPQALAAGKPVVAYDCDGAREICLDSQTGFLVQPGDLTNLKERLLQLAGNPPLCKMLGLSGSDFVRKNFAVEKMVDDQYNVYLKLAAERGIRA